MDKAQEPPRVFNRQGALARDGAGRVRQDFTLDGQEALPLATISDPAGAFVLLDARTLAGSRASLRRSRRA